MNKLEQDIQNKVDKINTLLKQIPEGRITRKQAESIKYTFNRGLNKLSETPEYKTRLNLLQCILGYYNVLSEGKTPDEAFSIVAKEYGISEEEIKQAKNRPFLDFAGNKTPRDVVKHHDTHPKQIEMKKKKTFKRTPLTSARTPNSQLRELHHQVSLHDNLVRLEGIEKQSQIANAKADTINKEITPIFDKLQIDMISDKDKCFMLLDRGYPNEIIIEALSLNRRTFFRWKKEYTSPPHNVTE